MSVYKHKNGRWYYKFVIDGVQYHKACKGATDLKSARKCEIEALDGVCEEGSKYKKKKPVTIKEAMRVYENYAVNNKVSYITDYSFISKITDFFGANSIITSITPSRIDDFKKAIKTQIVDRKVKLPNPDYPHKSSRKKYIYKFEKAEKILSASTINKHVNALSKTFNLLIANNLIEDSNPCKYSKKLREDDVKIRFLTEEEEKRIFKAFTPDNEHIRNIIICALQTGMRKSEILKLKWSQVDLENKTITILYSQTLKTKNKGKNSRVLDINSKLYEILTIFDDSKEYVFVNPKTNKPFTHIDKSFSSLLRAAKIINFRFHDIRHTVATRMVADGIDLVAIKDLLGHSSIQTTMIYAHSMPEMKKRAMEILSKY
jgi:integrase